MRRCGVRGGSVGTFDGDARSLELGSLEFGLADLFRDSLSHRELGRDRLRLGQLRLDICSLGICSLGIRRFRRQGIDLRPRRGDRLDRFDRSAFFDCRSRLGCLLGLRCLQLDRLPLGDPQFGYPQFGCP